MRRSIALAIAVLAAASGTAFIVTGKGRILVAVTARGGLPLSRVDVILDGKRFGCHHLPCVIAEQSRGVHDLQILAAGFAPASPKQVEVRARTDVMVSFVLEALPSLGLKIAGSWPGLMLSVDDRAVGELPRDLPELALGVHRVRVTGGDAYQPFETRVMLEPAKLTDLGVIKLKLLKGQVKILPGPIAPDQIQLWSLDERYTLHDLPTTRTVPADGRWAIRASKKGYAEYLQTIDFDDGKPEKTYTVTFAEFQSQWGRAGPPPVTSPKLLTGFDISSAVVRNTPSVKRSCWQPALKSRAPDAPTTLRIDLVLMLLPNGRVKSVTSSGDVPGYPGLSGCVASQVKAWRFPHFSEETIVNVPLVFGGE
ncbi:MAG: hypothetical protein WDO69_11515 [Pseudomonadota bacterium]